MNFENLSEKDLALELITRSKTNSAELNEEDLKSINEMMWAMDGSPKIRECLEHLLEVVIRQSTELDFNKSMVNAIEMNTVITHYDGLYIEKRLKRIEKHLGIEIDFEG